MREKPGRPGSPTDTGKLLNGVALATVLGARRSAVLMAADEIRVATGQRTIGGAHTSAAPQLADMPAGTAHSGG